MRVTKFFIPKILFAISVLILAVGYSNNKVDHEETLGEISLLNTTLPTLPKQSEQNTKSSLINTEKMKNLPNIIVIYGQELKLEDIIKENKKKLAQNTSTDEKQQDEQTTRTNNKKVNYCFAFKWGSLGEDDGQFLRPHDLDFDSNGNLYISDRDRNDIQKFSNDGTFIMKWGSKGADPGQFLIPYSIEIDNDDNLYVADRGNDRFQKFSADGIFIAEWVRPNTMNNTGDGTGDEGNLLEEFHAPEDIVVDNKNGHIYVTDTGLNRVIKMDKDFNYILEWGAENYIASGEQGKFNHPHGIDIDSQGNVYVNELEIPRIQKFDSNGKFIKQWGSAGKGDGQFTPLLEHLEIDDNTDLVFMVDGADNPRIQIFDKEGNFLSAFGTHGIGNGQFNKPEHVNIDDSGNVYVIDRGNQRIQVFNPC